MTYDTSAARCSPTAGLQARDIAEQLGNSAEVCERVYVHASEDRARDRLRIAFGGAPHEAKNATG
jgi:hypothetical protein